MPLPAAIILILFAAAGGWIACFTHLRLQAKIDPAQRPLDRRERILVAHALNHLADDAEQEAEALRESGFRVLDPVSADKELRRLADDFQAGR